MEDISLQAKIDVLTEEQVLIQDSAVAFIARDPELRQARANRFVRPGFDRALWREIADAGPGAHASRDPQGQDEQPRRLHRNAPRQCWACNMQRRREGLTRR